MNRSLCKTGFICLVLGGIASGMAAAATLSVETNNQQQITQWGIVTYNRPDWGTAWDITGYPQAVEAAYNELGATVLRFHIDYQTYDKTAPKEYLRDAILAATDKGMDWYGLPWSPPAFMKTINHVNGRVNGVSNHLAAGYEDEVAQWMVDLIQWLETQGVPLPLAIGFQNEPDWDPPSYPGCLYSAEQILTATIELRNRLDAAGYTNIRVISNDGGAPYDRYADSDDPAKGTINQMGLNPGGTFETNTVYREALDIVSTHTYDIHNGLYAANPGYMQKFYDSVVNSGKELWMTEWEPTPAHTFNDWDVIAESMAHFNRDISSMAFNGWFHWHIWRGAAFDEGSNDAGDCLHRIRPGDYHVFNGLQLGTNPASLAVRVSANIDKITLSVHIDSANGTKICERLIPTTALNDRDFQTLEIPLAAVSGTHDVYIRFSSPEAWREADFNWMQFAGQSRIEAEDSDSKVTVETWSSTVAPCYNVDNRMHMLYSNGQTVQRRPLYYIFKKLWNNAPTGEPAFVRRVRSDSPAFQGESKAASPASYRQDLCALVHSNAMTVVALNRNAIAETVDFAGLTGTNATLYRYEESDAWTVDVDLTEIGTFSISNGTLAGVLLPAKSLTIVQTDSGGDLSAGAGIGTGGYIPAGGGETQPFVSAMPDSGFEAAGALGTPPINTATNTTQPDSLYNQTTTPGAVTTLDQGWFSGSTSRITLGGTTNKYARFAPNAGWDKTDRWWIGQMWTDNKLTGLKEIAFDIVEASYNDGDPSRKVIIEVYTVPLPTPENAKLRLSDGTSSFFLLGSRTVDVTAGIGTYTSGDIDFTSSSGLFAMRIKVRTDGTLPAGYLGLDNLAIGAPLKTDILGIQPLENFGIKMWLDGGVPLNYHPTGKTNLTDAAWNRIAHSISTALPYAVTNLGYSSISGTNRVIYLEAVSDIAFFRMGND